MPKRIEDMDEAELMEENTRIEDQMNSLVKDKIRAQKALKKLPCLRSAESITTGWYYCQEDDVFFYLNDKGFWFDNDYSKGDAIHYNRDCIFWKHHVIFKPDSYNYPAKLVYEQFLGRYPKFKAVGSNDVPLQRYLKNNIPDSVLKTVKA